MLWRSCAVTKPRHDQILKRLHLLQLDFFRLGEFKKRKEKQRLTLTRRLRGEEFAGSDGSPQRQLVLEERHHLLNRRTRIPQVEGLGGAGGIERLLGQPDNVEQVQGV